MSEGIEQKTKKRKRKTKFKAKKLIIFLILLAVGFYGLSTFNNIQKLKKEEAKNKAEIKKLKEEKKDLEEEMKRIDDPEYVEEAARKFLKMVKKEETLYVEPK